MRSWSIPAGHIFGIEIRIDLSFVLLLFAIGLIERMSHIPINPERGFALVGIIFGSVVLHELGHALAARKAGISPRAVVLMPIGGITIFDEAQPAIMPDWKRDVRIAAAGPLVSLAIAGVSAAAFTAGMANPHLWGDFYVTSSN